MQHKILLSVALLLGGFYGAPAFSIFCPNNFNSINLGDSLDSVLQTCGNPLSQSTYQEKNYSYQEWVYYVNQGFNQGSTTLTVIFSNNQVVNISMLMNFKSCVSSVNAFGRPQSNKDCIPTISQRTVSLPNTNICGGFISLNDSIQTVQNACGQPQLVNHQGSPSVEKTITALKYSGPPPTVLIFENGVLTNRVQN